MKLIVMRGWTRHSEAIYRGKRLTWGEWAGQTQQELALQLWGMWVSAPLCVYGGCHCLALPPSHTETNSSRGPGLCCSGQCFLPAEGGSRGTACLEGAYWDARGQVSHAPSRQLAHTNLLQVGWEPGHLWGSTGLATTYVLFSQP